MKDWTAKYCEFYQNRKSKFTVEIADDEQTAKLHVHGRRSHPLRVPISSPYNYQMFQTSEYLASGVLTGYLHKVGRVVFWAPFRLAEFRLERLARRIEKQESAWELGVQPRAIPKALRTNLLEQISRIASPALQRRDDEPVAEHMRRSAVSAWQLKVLQTLAMDVKSVRLSIKTADDANGPLRFRLSVTAEKQAISEIAGSGIGRVSRFGAIRSELDGAMFAYQGVLPTTLRPAAGWPLPAVAAPADNNLELVIGSDFEGEGPLLYGGVATQNARALYQDIEHLSSNQRKTGDVVVTESATVKDAFIGVTFREPDRLLFALCSRAEMCREFLKNETSGVQTEQARPVTLAFRLNVGKLAEIGQGAKTERGRLANGVLQRFEQLVYTGLAYAKTQGAPNRFKVSVQEQFVGGVEKFADARLERRYFRAVESLEFLKKLGSFSPRMSFRHWLSPKSGVIDCRVETTPGRLVIEGSIGRDLCRFLLAHCHAIEARMESFENRGTSDGDIHEQISDLKRQREALKAELKKLKEGQ
jgi:hypothetical protein